MQINTKPIKLVLLELCNQIRRSQNTSVFTSVLVVFAMMAIMVRRCNGADTRNTNDLTNKYVSHPQCNKNITKHSIIVEEENKYIMPSQMEVGWNIYYM